MGKTQKSAVCFSPCMDGSSQEGELRLHIMPPQGAMGKSKGDSGSDDGGNGQKGRGHVPKSKRQCVEEVDVLFDEDFQVNEVTAIEAHRMRGGERDWVLGKMRLRGNRWWLSNNTAQRLLAGCRQEHSRSQGIVIADIGIHRQAGGAVQALLNVAWGTIVTAAEGACPDKAPVAQPQPRQAEPPQPQAAMGAPRTSSTAVATEGALARPTTTQFHASGSAAALGGGGGQERRCPLPRGENKRNAEGNDDDDEPLSNRRKTTRQDDEQEERSKLWVDCEAFWGRGPGKPLRDAVVYCTDYFIAITNGDARAEPPPMFIMPPRDLSRLNIDDLAQHEPDLYRARNSERVVLRTIHGWIFK
ncbi:hypothetical protein CBR_g34532 [Chara braunii]|uniref:Uncharacterized protein n=1 Tax=Chara braunii TaxID=69332 RepID=A0A388LIV2_CHABU|nr:hypothetical protein CBR_g34532 [Chara braunii]|eukprot:GBG82249.1 hypothetical protein CBR_g34532 [Chara braunii]